MNLLSKMFGGRKPQKPIAEMALVEVVSLVQAHKSLAADDAIAAARRLTDIAMFEHGVSDVERQFALALIPGLDAAIETALQQESGVYEAYIAFQAYLEAAAHHRGTARYYGYASLKWKMDEEGIEAAEVIPFMARADHADLLPTCLEMFEPDDIRDIRGALLTELATARAQQGERPLDVLNRLASGDDGALSLLLDGIQLGALRRAQSEPEVAEAVLSELGVGL